MKRFANLLLIMTFFSGMLVAEENSFTFSVRHDHFWRFEMGELTFTTKGIVYRSEDDEKHAREWAYEDIQEVKVASPTEVEILTYEDVIGKLNDDRKFKFKRVDPEIRPEVVQFLRQHATSRVVSAVFAVPQDVFYTVPAKHRHTWGGGCEGELHFSDAGIYYFSPSNREHSRSWPIRSIQSIGRMSLFTFRVTVPEEGATGAWRNFQFQLKRPMSEEVYQLLWRKIWEPESWVSRLAGSWEEEPDKFPINGAPAK